MVLWRSLRLQPAWPSCMGQGKCFPAPEFWAWGNHQPLSNLHQFPSPGCKQRFPLADRCLLGNWTTADKNRTETHQPAEPKQWDGKEGEGCGKTWSGWWVASCRQTYCLHWHVICPSLQLVLQFPRMPGLVAHPSLPNALWGKLWCPHALSLPHPFLMKPMHLGRG